MLRYLLHFETALHWVSNHFRAGLLLNPSSFPWSSALPGLRFTAKKPKTGPVPPSDSHTAFVRVCSLLCCTRRMRDTTMHPSNPAPYSVMDCDSLQTSTWNSFFTRSSHERSLIWGESSYFPCDLRSCGNSRVVLTDSKWAQLPKQTHNPRRLEHVCIAQLGSSVMICSGNTHVG